MLLVLSAAAAIALLIASYHDIRHRSIPNWLPLSVAAAGLLKWLVLGQLAPALWAAAAAAIVFAVSALMFTQGWIGGGDVKLGTAVVFFLGAPATLQFLVLMALAGGALAIVLLIVSRGASERPTIPYGVAIAAAAIAMMALGWRDQWQA